MSRRRAVQLALAPLLGLAAALLVACGSSGSSKLIPLANAGPLQSDFQEVAEKAETANGNCGATEKALLKTEQDFAALPSSTDSGLRERLREGIGNLHQKALAACQQLSQTSTGTTSTPTTTTPPTTTPQTTSTPTTTTPPTTTPAQPPTTPETGGAAPETESERGPAPGGGTGPGNGNGNGNGNGKDNGNGNGNGLGGQEPGR